MPFERRIGWLSDIIHNCDRIGHHVAGMTSDSYATDTKTIDAVERCLLRICEAAKRLRDQETKSEDLEPLDAVYPDIPWASIRGMGNALRHEYDDLDHNIIWITITERLRPLRTVADQEIDRLRRLRQNNKPRKRLQD